LTSSPRPGPKRRSFLVRRLGALFFFNSPSFGLLSFDSPNVPSPNVWKNGLFSCPLNEWAATPALSLVWGFLVFPGKRSSLSCCFWNHLEQPRLTWWRRAKGLGGLGWPTFIFFPLPCNFSSRSANPRFFFPFWWPSSFFRVPQADRLWGSFCALGGPFLFFCYLRLRTFRLVCELQFFTLKLVL